MKKLIVGIGYKARHGKNTVAGYIHEILPALSQIRGFSDALKAYCRVNGWMGEKDGKILQLVGTDLMKRQNPDIWINVLAQTIGDDDIPIVIIPDMRFQNEAEWIKSNGGITVNVRRLNPDGSLFISPDRPPYHPSETDLDGYSFDVTMKSSTGLAPLKTQAKRLADDILYEYSYRM